MIDGAVHSDGTVPNYTITASLMLLCAFFTLVSPLVAFAAVVNPGDLVVGNILAPGGPSNIVAVNPSNGKQTVFSTAANFPTGIAFASSRDLYVTDLNNLAIIRLDLATGNPQVVSSGGNLRSPLGLAIGPSGDLFVLNGLNAFGVPIALIRVNPRTGEQFVVSSGGLFTPPSQPNRLAIDHNGDILVTDGSLGRVIKINNATGEQTIVSSGGILFSPRGIAVDGNGDILVADNGIVRIDPVTGAQTIVSPASGLMAGGPEGIAVASSGDLFVTVIGRGAVNAGVIRVDPATGEQSAVSIGGNFSFVPIDIAIVPRLPVGGSVTGVRPTEVICHNLSTEQTVVIEIPDGATSWDCEAAGLVVNPGDTIRQKVLGTVN